MAIDFNEKMQLIECLRAFANRSQLVCTVDDCSLSGRLDVRFSNLNSEKDLIYHGTINVYKATVEDIPKILSNIYGMTAYLLMHKVRAKTFNALYDASKKKPSIKKVIFNAPATIVMWSDGSKTVVKCSEGEVYDPEKGLAMAMAKKMLGNEGNYYNEFKKWLPEDIAE